MKFELKRTERFIVDPETYAIFDEFRDCVFISYAMKHSLQKIKN